jgi:formylglycine-generating enzyme required for sulfatase activity
MLIIFAGLCWLVPAAPPAQEPERSISIAKLPAASPIARQWLVLIAIDDYIHKHFLNDLKSCRADAVAFRDLLYARFGYSSQYTLEMYDADATANRIRQALFDLPDRVAADDSVIIFFAGHGYYDAKKQMGFWYAHDAQGPWDGIANSQIKDWCRALPANKVLVLADSCFSGSLLTRSGFLSDATLKSRELLASGGLHPVADAGSPDGKHSVFNHYLRTTLERLAQKNQPFVLNELFVDLYTPVRVNSRQEPQKGILQDTLHEGGQFLFYPRGSTPAPAVPPVKTDAEVHTPLEIPSFDTEAMEKAAEARRKAEEEVRQFCERAQSALAALLQKDGDEFITAQEKAAKYKEFLDAFRRKNEECDARLSTEFARAEERMNHWRTWKPAPTPRPTSAPTLATASPAARRTESEYEQDGRRYRKVDLGDGVTMNLVYIRGGTFTMGSPENESGRSSVEGSQTRVTLTDDFWMGETEVTNAQYKRFLEESGYDGSGDADSDYLKHFRGQSDMPVGSSHPVVWVSWKNAMAFCEWASRKSGMKVTLPTEAQWEYACRANPSKTTRYSFGDSDSSLGDYAWYDKNSGGKTQPVKTKKPNAWGLYDMHGNVWEWCLDWYSDKLPGGSVTNPPGPGSGGSRVVRGGSGSSLPVGCRSADRYRYTPSFTHNLNGFRVVAVPRP